MNIVYYITHDELIPNVKHDDFCEEIKEYFHPGERGEPKWNATIVSPKGVIAVFEDSMDHASSSLYFMRDVLAKISSDYGFSLDWCFIIQDGPFSRPYAMSKGDDGSVLMTELGMMTMFDPSLIRSMAESARPEESYNLPSIDPKPELPWKDLSSPMNAEDLASELGVDLFVIHTLCDTGRHVKGKVISRSGSRFFATDPLPSKLLSRLNFPKAGV